jgi:glutathione S-transferase
VSAYAPRVLARPAVHHIPVCPFCQRLEILLELKGRRADVDFHVVDITRPRDPELLAKTRGTTAMPILETTDGTVLRESLVLMRYLDELFPDRPVARRDPLEGAIENLMTSLEGPFVSAGYRLVMNQDLAKRESLTQGMLAQYAELESCLRQYARGDTFLFESFGWVEAVFTPMFMRFWFLEYYEGFALPETEAFARVRRFRDACLAHPAAQQVSREEIVKSYYDYAKGAGNGALVHGRTRSSFVFEPHWRDRPWPPADKYGHAATDAELGLVSHAEVSS